MCVPKSIIMISFRFFWDKVRLSGQRWSTINFISARHKATPLRLHGRLLHTRRQRWRKIHVECVACKQSGGATECYPHRLLLHSTEEGHTCKNCSISTIKMWWLLQYILESVLVRLSFCQISVNHPVALYNYIITIQASTHNLHNDSDR